MTEIFSNQPPSKTILIVEDNPNDEALILRSLKKTNVANRISIARDGEEALDYIFASGKYADRDPFDTPTVVLLDIKLPKVDGLEVLKKLRSHELTHCLPVVILTSSDEERDIVESCRLNANSYVRKPIKFDEFATSVQQVGHYWLSLNRQIPQRIL
jgi:two-component system response regulator